MEQNFGVLVTRKTFAHSPVLALLALIFVVTAPVAHAAAVEGSQALKVGGPSDWDSTHIFRPWVIYDGSSFMMWFAGENSQGIDRIGMATSSDGKSWTKYSGNPVLDVGPPGSWDGDSVTDPTVIHENGQYEMWYTGQTFGATTTDDVYRIGYATSPDGIHWTRYSGNPVLSTGSLGSWDDRRVWRSSVISTGSGYVMYYRGAAIIEGSAAQAGVATSPDGMQWTKTAVLTMPPGTSGWDAYSRQVSALNIGGVMRSADGTYIMSYASIKARNAPAQIGLATSQDGIKWTPYPDNPVITYGSSGGWDGGPEGVGAGNSAGSMILAAQGQYYVYYGAQDPGGTFTIGMATLSISLGGTASTSSTSSSTVAVSTTSSVESTSSVEITSSTQLTTQSLTQSVTSSAQTITTPFTLTTPSTSISTGEVPQQAFLTGIQLTELALAGGLIAVIAVAMMVLRNQYDQQEKTRAL